MKLRFLIPLMIVLCSCVGLTPAQRTLWSISIYEGEYQRYLDTVIDPTISTAEKDILKANPELITPDKINPNLTDDQKKMLRVKKEILIELKPIVIMAADYQITGQLPSSEIQAKLTDLINKLVELSGD